MNYPSPIITEECDCEWCFLVAINPFWPWSCIVADA